MKNLTHLSALHQRYLQGELTKKEFEEYIFKYLLNNHERLNPFKRNEECFMDFLSLLYPRISRAVDNYKDKGASFEAYLTSIIHWSQKDYKIRESNHFITEYSCWKARAEEISSENPEPEYIGTEIDPGLHEVLENYTRRQILILFLKSYYFVSEDLLRRVANILEMRQEELWALVEQLRTQRMKHERAVSELKARVHSQYYRCLTIQNRIAAALPESALYEKLKTHYEKATLRLQNMKTRLAGFKVDASNRQIAEILKLSKGTIDSTLHVIHEKAKRLETNRDKTGNCVRHGSNVRPAGSKPAALSN